MTLTSFFSLLIGLAYLVTAFFIFHNVMPYWRKVNRFAALFAWAFGAGSGWFGVLIITEGLGYAPQPEARLFGHFLLLIGLWCGIATQLHLNGKRIGI